MKPSIYEATRLPAIAALSILCQRKVEGSKLPIPKGPLIIAANHLSWIDIPLLGVSIPRRIGFMAKKEYFYSPFHAFLLRIFGGFTVERGAADRKALQQANELLKNGFALGIFPEGTRSRTAQLQRARPGAAFLALQNKASILPVGISGTEKIRERYENITRLFRRPKVTINIGESFELSTTNSKPTREELASHGDMIMRRIAELLPKDYRGVYKEDAN